MCLICFLRNDKQYLLRHSAMIRSDRFEHALEIYKDEFISTFTKEISKKSTKKDTPPLCEEYINNNNIQIYEALKTINKDDIETAFTLLRNIYTSWINASLYQSLNCCKKYLKNYGIDKYTNKIQSEVLFRSRESNSFISHWDMFHIPFNKRYLIGNQRYSITGQPLLYFSTSPYGAYIELGKHEDLRTSSFILKSPNSLNIFENENKFETLIIKNDQKINNNVAPMLNYELLSDNSIISMFYLMILSSCCSFPKRNITQDNSSTKFIEEYVLPQVLTCVIKSKKNCDGIKYTSTKSHTDYFKDENPELKSLLYSNYCIFTNYKCSSYTKVKDVYDRKLFNKFLITNPLLFNENIHESFYNIDELQLIVKEINDDDTICSQYKNVSYSLDTILNNLKEIIESIPSEALLIKNFLNQHIVFIRNILLNIKDKKEVNYE